MAGEESPTEDESEAAFAAQARAAGIVLPKKARRDPWSAVVVVVALIVLTAGIGEVTGWVNLRAPSTAGGGNFETQTCTGTSVHAYGSISAAFDPAFSAWLGANGQQMSQAVGGCFTVEVNSSSGDGYLPPLGGRDSEFAATYTAPTSVEASQLPYPVVVLPVALSAVAVIYNLPGIPAGLNLTGAILAGIYNGTISSWDAAGIAAANPGTDLAGLAPVAPLELSGASVSNEVFSSYLAASSPSWDARVGSGLSVAWPSGATVGSDAAMLSAVEASPGSVGYIEIFGAPPSGVGWAQVEDAAGDFAAPNAVDTWVAANAFGNSSAVTTGHWSGFSLLKANATGSYPLSVLSYAGIYRDLGVAYGGSLSYSNATWLLTYLYWLAGGSTVAPLPLAYDVEATNILNNETYDGSTIVHLENENGESGESGGETGEF